MRRRGSPSIETIRNAHVRRVLADRYRGQPLPDDDAGRSDLAIAVQILVDTGVGQPAALRYIGVMAPWMSATEADDLADAAYINPIKYTAESLAHALCLTDAKRTKLRVFTIGAADLSRQKRADRSKAKRVERQRDRRRAKGVKPRAEYESGSMSVLMPWKAFGISRRTWERKGKPMPQNVASVKPASYLAASDLRHKAESGGGAKRSAAPGRKARAEGEAA